eukprot:gene2974-4223_t
MEDPMTATPGTRILETTEGQRLATQDAERWREWGPYLSERQWGTVREDYSADGDAWPTSPMNMPATAPNGGVKMARPGSAA